MAKLSSIVQGVEFEVTISDEVVRVVVFAEVLVQRFGADDSADGWLSTFDARRADIVDAAMRRYQAGRTVVVLNHRAFSDG